MSKTSTKRKREFTGMSELEEAYGMALNAPHGFEGFRDGVGQDPAKAGDVRYRQGRPVEPAQLRSQGALRTKRAQGVTPTQGAVAATRVSPTVAIVTVRLPGPGFRTVLVASGGARLLELWRTEEDITPFKAGQRHNQIVAKGRAYLESQALADSGFPVAELAVRAPVVHRPRSSGWVLNEHGRAVRA